MWSPTHVQVTVQKARGLLIKGKNGLNDAFVTIALGKEKYQTSVKEKAPSNIEWHEECELEIPKHGNTAEITLTALHRNFLGVDEFLGTVSIPLAEFDVYERPRNRWYTLRGKPGKEKGKDKQRGELEVKVGFIVKAGSLTDLSKKEKHKSSLGQLSHMAQSVGGSLLSIGSLEKKKGLKKLAKSIGAKVGRGSKKQISEEVLPEGLVYQSYGQRIGDADPGVISEGESDDEFRFDELSHKSSGSSLNVHGSTGAHHTPVSGSMENLAGGEFLRRSASGVSNSSLGRNTLSPPSKPPRTLVPNASPLSANPPADEWEQKLYGGRKDSPSTDTLKRRSWESPRIPVVSQPQEDIPPPLPLSPAPTALAAPASPALTASPAVPSSPGLPASPSFNKTISGLSSTFGSQQSIGSGGAEPERVEEDKEKTKSNLKAKFKNFRMGKEAKSPAPEPPSSTNAIPDVRGERIIVGREKDKNGQSSPQMQSRLSSEVLRRFEEKSREDLIEMILQMEGNAEKQKKRVKDLEDYLDNLLLRVMETTPRILQNPFITCKAQASFS